MICEHCKERHANVTVTQVQNGEKMERHYCEVCASKFHPFQFDLKDEPISLQQFITNWFGSPLKQTTKEGQSLQNKPKNCPTCEMSYSQFLKKGKFGCASCYATFKPYLPPMFNKLHAGTKHKPTSEEMLSPRRQIQLQVQQMREQIKVAIEEERFEDAAKLRDEIKALERQLSSGGVDSP
mgnify:FL=1